MHYVCILNSRFQSFYLFLLSRSCNVEKQNVSIRFNLVFLRSKPVEADCYTPLDPMDHNSSQIEEMWIGSGVAEREGGGLRPGHTTLWNHVTCM